MTQSSTSTDLKEMLTFPFQDPNWKNKFLIGSLITLAGFIIPFVPVLLLYGYTMQIMRPIIVEQGKPFLPEWDKWDKLLFDGVKLFGVVFIYMLPFMILLFVGMSFFFVPVAAGIPLMEGLEEGGDGAAGIILTIVTVVSILGAMVLIGLGTILAVAVGVVMPAVVGHIVATDEFGAAFRVREWWPIFRANLAGFLLAYVMVMVASIVLSSGLMVIYVTVILCCLIPIIMGPVTMYLLAIYGALFGQAYRDGVQKLESQAGTVQA
jgi:hypothetical protein